MNNIFVTGDPHFRHYNAILHCNRLPWIIPNPKYDPTRPYHFKFNNPKAADLEKHDHDLIQNWNNIVDRSDTVYIIGDFAWKDHNYFINALHGKKILVLGNHDKMKQEWMRNFTEVHPILRRTLYGQDVTMCHYCMVTWASSVHGAWHLYGHSHGRIKEFEDCYKCDVGVDVWDYTPVPWQVIAHKMSLKKKKEFYDTGESERNILANRELNKMIWEDFKIKRYEKTLQKETPVLPNVQTSQDEESEEMES